MQLKGSSCKRRARRQPPEVLLTIVSNAYIYTAYLEDLFQKWAANNQDSLRSLREIRVDACLSRFLPVENSM